MIQFLKSIPIAIIFTLSLPIALISFLWEMQVHAWYFGRRYFQKIIHRRDGGFP